MDNVSLATGFNSILRAAHMKRRGVGKMSHVDESIYRPHEMFSDMGQSQYDNNNMANLLSPTALSKIE